MTKAELIDKIAAAACLPARRAGTSKASANRMLIAAEALALAYRMLDCIPPEKIERDGFKNSLEELSLRYRHALKNTSSIPIPKKLQPAMARFSNEIIKELEPFLKSFLPTRRSGGPADGSQAGKDQDPDTDQWDHLAPYILALTAQDDGRRNLLICCFVHKHLCSICLVSLSGMAKVPRVQAKKSFVQCLKGTIPEYLPA